MGRKPRVDRFPEEKWQIVRKASRAGTSRRCVGVVISGAVHSQAREMVTQGTTAALGRSWDGIFRSAVGP
jgi:hypothetical protein